MRHKGATNIGTPLDESFASLVIVENDKEVAEDNEVGEIAIYGRGVPPEGYLNGENDNARKAFRDVHFRNKNIKRRCYATGDLGYFDSKTKEYYLLGRIESDRQVKIRGHRIELEGVESVLRERCESVLIPNVIESSILCFLDERSSDKNDDAGKEIVAFLKLVEEEDEEYQEEENRRARRMDVLLAVDLNCAPWLLSNGSMPRKFVFLEKDEDVTIPLSATGKRDFHAFYDRHRDKERFSVLASDEADDAKKDQLETLVAKCWADALSCGVDFEKIKKNDSFVRLGGNSMSALIACRKLREALNASSLRDDGNDQNEDENEPGVKKSEAGALLAPAGESDAAEAVETGGPADARDRAEAEASGAGARAQAEDQVRDRPRAAEGAEAPARAEAEAPAGAEAEAEAQAEAEARAQAEADVEAQAEPGAGADEEADRRARRRAARRRRARRARMEEPARAPAPETEGAPRLLPVDAFDAQRER